MAIPILPIIEIGARLIDKLIPDKEVAAKAKLDLLLAQQQGELKELEIRMSAILAEAQSADPWTSRARPAFMWFFYLLLGALTIAAPFVGVFAPEAMAQFYVNVARGFAAMPSELWTTFTVGYLGYTAARQYGKAQGTDR